MTPLKNSIATKAVALLALLLASQAAVADPAGVVSASTGPLLAKGATGSIKVLVVGSSVNPLDTLVSRHGVYARITLTDHTDLALAPDTELAIEKYSFHEKDSQANTALLRLTKGSVRVTSGALSTRTTDTFTLAAGTTTVDIHHSAFIATYIEQPQGGLGRLDHASPLAPTLAAANAPATDSPPAYLTSQREMALSGNAASATKTTFATHDMLLAAMDYAQSGRPYMRVSSSLSYPTQPPELTDSPIQLAQNAPSVSGAGLNPGLYVQVLDGTINVSNGGGTQNFTAGQFGFTPSFQQPPVILPANPGIQFTPPPSFSSTTGSQSGTSGAKPGDVDCQVR